MRRLTTLAMVPAVLMAGCGSSKPTPSPSTAAPTASSQNPLARCVRAWNEGAGQEERMKIAGEARPSQVATVAVFSGSERTYDLLRGQEGANPAAWATIEPGACMVVANFTIFVQQPGGSWVVPSDTPGDPKSFQPIAENGEKWSGEHANVSVAPQRNISLETANGQTPKSPGGEGKLTVAGSDRAFQMTAQEVGGYDYAEKQKTEAELAGNRTSAHEQGKQSRTTPTAPVKPTKTPSMKSAQETEVCTTTDEKFGECKAGEIVPKNRQ
jgi:hypothetical protein